MGRRLLAVAGLAALATATCHRPRAGGAPTRPAAPSMPAAAPPAGPVRLSWTLLDTRRWIGGDGEQHQSSTVTLAVENGTPARIPLGERASFGCAVLEPEADDRATLTDEALVATLDCRDGAHRETVRVTRPRSGELRVEAFAQDGAIDAPRTHEQSATLRIPPEASVVVDHELVQLPDDATWRPRAP